VPKETAFFAFIQKRHLRTGGDIQTNDEIPRHFGNAHNLGAFLRKRTGIILLGTASILVEGRRPEQND
jgi:hypothetical protein